MAAEARTSHATLSAYEAGRVAPAVETLERVIKSAGFDLEVRVTRRISRDGGLERGAELASVLRLAAQFPDRHAAKLGPAKFPQ